MADAQPVVPTPAPVEEQGPWSQYQTAAPAAAVEERGPWNEYQTPAQTTTPPETTTPEPSAPAFGMAVAGTSGLGKGAWDLNKYRKAGFTTPPDESPYGVQKYLNKQLRATSVPRGTVSLEDLGTAVNAPYSIRSMNEVQDALKAIKGAPGEQVPITEIIQGVPTVTGFKTVGGTPPIDLSPYVKMSALEQNAPKVADFLNKYEKPISAVEKHVALPAALGVSAAEAQAAANRAREGHGGMAALDIAGAIGAPMAAAKFLPKKLRILGGLAAATAPAAEAVRGAIQDHAAGGAIEGYASGSSVVKGALQLFERAPAKSSAEIAALAQRMAPQVLGQYVPEATGKSLKQFQREAELQHVITPNFERKQLDIYDPQQHIGAVQIGVPGDISRAHETIHEIAGRPLNSPSVQEGGPMYGLKDNFWASNLSPASGVQNLVNKASQAYGDAPVIASTMKMPEGMGYAQHYADALMKNIDYSKVKNIDEFNDIIRKGNPKSGPFPDFAGIENPDISLAQMEADPKLRTHFTGIMSKDKFTEPYGLPPGRDVLHAVSEPDLINLETGAGGKGIGMMQPGAELTSSEHPTYSHDIPGQLFGTAQYPMPYELQYPDMLNYIRQNPITYTTSAGKEGTVGEFGRLKMMQPRQVIDPQYADEISQYNEQMKSLTGLKKGGKVKRKKR